MVKMLRRLSVEIVAAEWWQAF